MGKKVMFECEDCDNEFSREFEGIERLIDYKYQQGIEWEKENGIEFLVSCPRCASDESVRIDDPNGVEVIEKEYPKPRWVTCPSCGRKSARREEHPTREEYICYNCGYEFNGVPDGETYRTGKEGHGIKCPSCGENSAHSDLHRTHFECRNCRYEFNRNGLPHKVQSVIHERSEERKKIREKRGIWSRIKNFFGK